MGNKYASFHVLNDKHEKVISGLTKFYRRKKTNDEKKMESVRKIGNEYLTRFTERYLDLFPDDVIIVEKGPLLSVYDSALSFETVEEKVLAVSNKMSYPIIYISNFDDDVLVFGIVASGELITSCTLGENLSFYGLVPREINAAKFDDVLKALSDKSFSNIGASTDFDEIEGFMEEILDAPLQLTKGDIENKAGCYELITEEPGVCVYKRVYLGT